jgi:hypothetical protein
MTGRPGVSGMLVAIGPRDKMQKLFSGIRPA